LKKQLKELIVPFLISVVILIILEIISTTILPVFGPSKYRLPFNILIVLFLALKLETPLIGIFIFLFQYMHSLFTIDGWEIGTIIGIVISIIISYLRDVIHLSSASSIFFVTMIFQFVWFVLASVLRYLHYGSLDFIIDKFWRFVPETIVISIVAPFAFIILDKVWQVNQGMLGEDV
jgi:hypothetical protein